MKTLATAQHTTEWYNARRCRISASEAHKALMRRGTKGRRFYVSKLADDLEGLPDFDDHEIKPWFSDGIYYESWARGWYSFKFDVDIIQTGFVVHDRYEWIGCSPDGLVGDHGLVEIKSRSRLRTFDKCARLGVTNQIYPQVQTQLFVTGRAWCDYVNYWRSDNHELEKGHVQRVDRDQAYINNTLLPAFVTLWKDIGEEVNRRKLQRRNAMR